MTWLILVDRLSDLPNHAVPHKVMTVSDYLTHPETFKDLRPKIINLARSTAYQASGYYASLLAEARGHRIVPSVETMLELSRKPLYRHALPELEDILNGALRQKGTSEEAPGVIDVLFGRTEAPPLERFARVLFDWFRAPALRVILEDGAWRAIKSIRPLSLSDLKGGDKEHFLGELNRYTQRSWRGPKVRPSLRHSLAVLFDPHDTLPPSSLKSIEHFARVAARHSIEVEPIQKRDLFRLAEFDALFIRETTSIDNHTYRFARRAAQEGMPVIDDPVSMIRCTNKVFLSELLTQHNLPTPRTLIVDSLRQMPDIARTLGWPVVLKVPDGSFSRGVFRVADEAEMKVRLEALLEESDLVLAQQFVPTSFDWRVGVLDGKPIFACQYLMAKKHWQIVRHEPGKPPVEGGFRSTPLADAPRHVVETAVKSARLIGDGFYGVDLPETENGVYVIEINDNPNLERGIEDSAEKDTVWEALAQWFAKRIEAPR